MHASTREQCRACLTTLKSIVSSLTGAKRQDAQVHREQAEDELWRFTLWAGNIGALNQPKSSMSLESRLRDASDVLNYVRELLNDLNEVTGEILKIVSGEREGKIASEAGADSDAENQSEELELLHELGDCTTRLFRVSSLIRHAASTDQFAKALTRKRYLFNDQFDISHVGEKFPKLATKELAWLRNRLGRAITQRRQYLSYIQDHRNEHESDTGHEDTFVPVASAMELLPDTTSQPSTFFTKASSLAQGHITAQTLNVQEYSDLENDERSCTTITRSMDGDLEFSIVDRIPMLDKLRTKSKKEVECPFCFRIHKFKNERVWRRHVFADLRSYVCTFPECDAPYFSDINEWFRHEMQYHRVSYICRLCQNRSFQLKDQYVAHIRRRHSELLEDGKEQPFIDMARKPLDCIPAQDCPCCSEWASRVKEHTTVTINPSDASVPILCVVPTVFKRHLASHLEQLALFAVQIGSSTDIDIDSNVAIEDDVGAVRLSSDLSTLAFDNIRSSSIAGEVQSSNENLLPQEAVKAAGSNESGSVNMADLEAAIQAAQQVINITPEDHPDRAVLFNNLGNKPCDQYTEQSHRSTTRVNTSSQASSARSARSFLFCVNELTVNEEPSLGGVRPDVNIFGRWSPPSYQEGFIRPYPGDLYRWHEGAISLATDCPLSNGRFRRRPGSHTPVTFYRNQTLFWCDDFHQFMTVPGDASEYDVAEDENIANHWWPLSFRHDGTNTRVEVSGIERHLATRHSPWVSDLGLNIFANPNPHPYPHPSHDRGGLSGNLALLIGLVVFSCTAADLRNVLLVDKAWSGYQWYPHKRVAGRTARRGVVVTIYLDPTNTTGSTPAILGYLEWKGPALLQ